MVRAKAEKIMRPIEKIGNNVKMAAWSAVIEAFALLILGVLLIAWPDLMITIISYIVGVFFIVRGAYQVITYFIEKGHQDYFNNDLLYGVISALIGVAALAIGDQIVDVFRVIIGIWIIYEALVRMNTAGKMAAVGIGSWKYVLLVAILMLGLGIFATFNHNADAYLIGWMMVIAGIVGMAGGVIIVQHVNAVIDVLTGKFNNYANKNVSITATGSSGGDDIKSKK